MGTKKCDRNGCQNTMCERYANEHGYICNECFDELCKKLEPLDIAAFMMSRKRKYPGVDPHKVFQLEEPLVMTFGA